MRIWTRLAAAGAQSGGRSGFQQGVGIPWPVHIEGGESIGSWCEINVTRGLRHCPSFRVVDHRTRQSAPLRQKAESFNERVEDQKPVGKLPFSTLQSGRSVPGWRSAWGERVGQHGLFPALNSSRLQNQEELRHSLRPCPAQGAALLRFTESAWRTVDIRSTSVSRSVSPFRIGRRCCCAASLSVIRSHATRQPLEGVPGATSLSLKRAQITRRAGEVAPAASSRIMPYLFLRATIRH